VCVAVLLVDTAANKLGGMRFLLRRLEMPKEYGIGYFASCFEAGK
jgi:hypothetical protein